MSFEAPLLIIVVFLLLTLLIGVFTIRRHTIFREYAIGNRQFSTATLVITLLASYYGGGILIRNVSIFPSNRFFWIIWQFFINGLIFLTISWLAGRMHKLTYHLSMPETIGRVYGKYPRMITALTGIFYLIVFLAIQINVISQAIRICIASDIHTITILTTIILCIYTMLGGIHAITFTDVWQFIIFFSIIPILTWMMFKNVGKPAAEIISFLQTQKKFELSMSNLFFPFNNKLLPILYYLSVIANIEPSVMQIVYMSSSPSQARKVFLYAAFFSCVIITCILLISLFVFIKMPDLPSVEIWNYVLASTPPYFKGLICVCLLAMAMSTADSKLHTSAIMISYDLLGNMRSIKRFCSDQILLARIAILLIAILAMLLALYKNFFAHLTSMLLSITCIYAVIVVAPFILAVLGFRSTTRTALMGMTTGLLTLFVWNKWISHMVGPTSGTFISIAANAVSMLTAHYIYGQRPRR
ncbi:sodium:solute symporter family protein [Cardinium endosymbiont of Nabis limbatus]|uniref:sodium:solute symporter family protein n=1 Tax=Cardinium endosymbiont of Nabis limbatus TaxID=3066217 RepID=UPI003AF38C73